MPQLRGSVVVVTGASSGLGRAIAIELAKQGASLVLAARRIDALDETADACRALGAIATVVDADVTIESEVAEIASAALDGHGRVDVWINNAGVTLYSPLEDGPFEEHQRVIETNLYGAMFGARVAVPIFRRQGRGVLINVASVLGEVGHAFVPSYVISKFGVHGLSEALRVELADQPDIHVCTVFPYAIDTQHFEAAANRIGRAPRALPPVQSPERVARAIARLVEHPRRTRHVPRSLVFGLALHGLLPRASERLLLDALRRWHISDHPEPLTSGNLYEPSQQVAHVHGTRPPMLTTARFAAWATVRFLRIELEAAARRMARARSWLSWRREALQAGRDVAA